MVGKKEQARAAGLTCGRADSAHAVDDCSREVGELKDAEVRQSAHDAAQQFHGTRAGRTGPDSACTAAFHRFAQHLQSAACARNEEAFMHHADDTEGSRASRWCRNLSGGRLVGCLVPRWQAGGQRAAPQQQHVQLRAAATQRCQPRAADLGAVVQAEDLGTMQILPIRLARQKTATNAVLCLGQQKRTPPVKLSNEQVTPSGDRLEGRRQLAALFAGAGHLLHLHHGESRRHQRVAVAAMSSSPDGTER